MRLWFWCRCGWKRGWIDWLRSVIPGALTPVDTSLWNIHTGVPPPDKLGRNPRRRVQSEEDQRYIAKLLACHGDDFKVRACVVFGDVSLPACLPARPLACLFRSTSS